MLLTLFYGSAAVAAASTVLGILSAWAARYFTLSDKVMMAVVFPFIGAAVIASIIFLFIVVNFSPFFTRMDAG